MMDTLAVALRVAEEAIEEAISKAEAHGDSLVWTPFSSLGRGGSGSWLPEKKCWLSGNQCQPLTPTKGIVPQTCPAIGHSLPLPSAGQAERGQLPAGPQGGAD